MKFVCALVILLYFCHSSNANVTKQLIRRLADLNNSYMDRDVNITSWETVQLPTKAMQKNATICVNTFKRALKRCIDSLTVSEDKKHLIEEITELLHRLPTPKEQDGQQDVNRGNECIMKANPRSKTPFKQYIHFLYELKNNTQG